MTKTTFVTINSIFSFGCALFASMFGGWTQGLTTLIILMILDYITGLMVAGIFHRSGKSGSGSLSSVAGLKGISKKVACLILVVVAYQMDKLLGVALIRDTATVALCVNEVISLLENIGLMGVKYPAVMEKALDILQSKVKDDTESVNH